MKTHIVYMRARIKVYSQSFLERDLARPRGDAATLTGADRYNAARRVERLQERRAALYA